MEETDIVTQKLRNIVVYYWSSLVFEKSANANSLDEQQQTFASWLHNQSNIGSEPHQKLILSATFTDNHLKTSKPKHFPELSKAINYCLQYNAKLVIVRLDGLISRDEFYNLLSSNGLDFVCIDKPLVTPASLPVVRQYVNEQSKQHSDSIKRGLRLTKHKLGNPYAAVAISPFNKIKTENSVLFALLLQPVLAKYQQQGFSQRKMVEELNKSGILAPEGGNWVLSQLQKILKRVDTNKKALELSTKITKNNYNGYSAVDLIAAFNQDNIRLTGGSELSEQLVTVLKDRQQTIINVLELYNFMQNWQNKVTDLINSGKTLDEIALEFNNSGIKIPNALADTNNNYLWDSTIVSELVKRINHRLYFNYDSSIKDSILLDLHNYINYANSSLPIEIAETVVSLYKNPVFSKMIV